MKTRSRRRTLGSGRLRGGVRRIPRSRRSATGAFWSHKNGCHVPFESSLERDAFLGPEYWVDISGYEAQPVRFRYVSASGCRTSGVIDLALERAGERFAFVDVKPQSELAAKKEALEVRFAAAREYAESESKQYFIWTEQQIRTSTLRNRWFLYRYLRAEPNLEHGLLLSTVLAQGKIIVRALLEMCSNDRSIQAEIVVTLWHYVATNRISCDLTRPVTLETELWMPRSDA